jgi:hypothetical protein
MGYSPQISTLYFMNKLSISLFGLIAHTALAQEAYFYLTDKMQAGAKGSNHIINYLLQYSIITLISQFHRELSAKVGEKDRNPLG